jgi:hypothetical protein
MGKNYSISFCRLKAAKSNIYDFAEDRDTVLSVNYC